MKATLRCLLVAQLAQCGCGLRAGAALRPLHSQPHALGGRPTLAHGLRMAADSDEEGAVGTDAARQLLGMKGAADDEDNIWKIRLQLTKPVTWVPLIWGVACGAAASGNYHWWNPLTIGQPGHIPFGLAATDLAKAATCMVLSGPFLTGYTQTINDWYDREIDAINEPYRPIPSGKISEFEVIAQIWVLLLAGIGTAYLCDNWAGHDFPVVTLLSVFGAFISYIYSAPPLKLKQSWVGNYALGASYISLPWWCGQARVPRDGRGDRSARRALSRSRRVPRAGDVRHSQPAGDGPHDTLLDRRAGDRHRQRLQIDRRRREGAKHPSRPRPPASRSSRANRPRHRRCWWRRRWASTRCQSSSASTRPSGSARRRST